MIDYEDMILARQEARDLEEDADDFEDDCSKCRHLEICRTEGLSEYPTCPSREED